ncbi:AAA family ATPase [Actinoplanes sp. ATCC 53533]|uniref:phosphorylase family protein n=1 Tax=Actinoplanes sp. ATCC 53533 TaxID=1288362 RepID=UPI00131578D7|nr:AAA family ATPase [Actinoplanes sp. ATCC 53533]
MDDGPVIVVLTALELEHRSIRQWLGRCRRVDHPSGTIFTVGRPPAGRGRIALAVTGEGNNAAAVLAERAIAMFRPRALMFVGVAGALRDDIDLGDVVVATKVYAYHGGTMRSDGFRARPRSWEAPHQLDQLARHVSRSDAWTGLLPPAAGRPRVHFRPIAAGEVVLNALDDPLSAQLRQTYGDAVAIEMESAGIAQAAHLNGALPVLTVRGISDKADGRKHAADDQGWQPAAADRAAAFALAVVAELLPASAAPAPPASAPAAPTDIPRQLPGRGGALVGRAAQLSRLDEILLRPAGDRPRIAVVTGMAGAGKTALAVDWAHDAAEAFPDGVLYADVRGFGPDQPLEPREVLAGFLRALGQSRAAEQGSLDERAARFRTALDGRRALVLLDNVQSIEQVRPLLPGAGSCAVLITSREALRGLAVRHAAEGWNSTGCHRPSRSPCCGPPSATARMPIPRRPTGWPGTAVACPWRCGSPPRWSPPGRTRTWPRWSATSSGAARRWTSSTPAMIRTRRSVTCCPGPTRRSTSGTRWPFADWACTPAAAWPWTPSPPCWTPPRPGPG